ncbi:MAG: CAP domain-containing protein [Planctomycetes bacterium]|nr:CAP domain-containing protein [Planctomycetota bacterium]
MRDTLTALVLVLAAAAAGGEAQPPSPAMVFCQLLEAPDSTREKREEVWAKLQEAGKTPPRPVVAAVEKVRDRAWSRLFSLLGSLQSKKPVAGLRSAMAPHQAKVRDVVNGAAFSKEKLDEAAAPIEKALEAAVAALEESEKFKPLDDSIQELETYAVGCGLRLGWSEELRGVLIRAALVNQAAGNTRWRSLLQANREAAAWIDPAEHACLEVLNTHRILVGLAPLEFDLRLVVAAKKHAEEMVAKTYFSHDSPTEALKTPWLRAGREHAKANGECIANGSESGVAIFRMWYYSQGHHKIVLGGGPTVGVGRCGSTWTLLTGGAAASSAAAAKMPAYVRKRYEAGERPEPLLELAKWCANNQLFTQAEDELERLLALAPDHAAAKKALERIRSRKR